MTPGEKKAGVSGETRAKEGQSQGTVQALSRMIRDLEEQLDRMLTINEALERDLEKERSHTSSLERRSEELMRKLKRAEQEIVGRENLLAEIGHLKDERARLSRAADELTRKLEAAERDRDDQEALAARLRAGRADAIEELQSVEAQFERAMQMVGDLKIRLTVLGEECDALRGRLKVSDDGLRRAEQERDEMLAEVEESRAALEDIRRSLVDACVVSQQRRIDPDDA